MSPTTVEENFDEKSYELARGSKIFGNFVVAWDLTDGLTKEQWIRERRIERGHKIQYVLKDGRIIMPFCGII